MKKKPTSPAPAPRSHSPESMAARAIAGAPTTASGHRAKLTRTLFLPVLLWATWGGCATVPAPATWQPGNVQPLIFGWQRYFEILWVVTRQDQGAFIEGYITNNWGFAVREVRVLVNGYDSSGTQTGQAIAWGPNEIAPGDRVYFDVTVPAAAATYEVSVFSWKWTWPPSAGPGRHEEESWSTKRDGNARSPEPLTPAGALTVPTPWTARRLVN